MDLSNKVTFDKNETPDVVCQKCRKSKMPKGNGMEEVNEFLKCSNCEKWQHFVCSGLEDFERNLYCKFYCSTCFELFGAHEKHEKVAPHRLHWWKQEEVAKPTEVGSEVWTMELISNMKDIPEASEADGFHRVKDGLEFFNKLNSLGGIEKWSDVFVVENKEGLNFQVPNKSEMTIDKLTEIMGHEYVVPTIDVYSQRTFSMKIGTFRDKIQDSRPRSSLYNFLSLEYSDHPRMKNIAQPPEFVKNISIVNQVHPEKGTDSYNMMKSRKTLSQSVRPAVEQFALAGMANSLTNFHLDFGGSSVFYHVVHGQKVFLVAPPTDDNLKKYLEYETADEDDEVWFGEKIRESMRKVVIDEGQTLLVPSGWLHAVWTPLDSLVFGGNFLHLANLSMQMKVYDIEMEIQETNNTDARFLFPNFENLHWEFARNVVSDRLKIANEKNDDVRKEHALMWEKSRELTDHLEKWIVKDENKRANGFKITLASITEKKRIVKELKAEIQKQETIQTGPARIPKRSGTTPSSVPPSTPSKKSRSSK